MSTNTRSLLRYPGSKARFSNFIASVINLNGIRDAVFVEPFCGGSSVSIALLEDNIVDRIALNDADPMIAALWDVVFTPVHAEWLAEQVMTIPLTIDEWIRQKTSKPLNSREMALKCLYLNRTSFNGIIHQAGPLGGWSQEKRTVGVRFNRERLSKRILELKRLYDRIEIVSNRPWYEFCVELERTPNAFFYLDPPYYHKAEQLYGHYFAHDDHCHLRDYLEQTETRWMLSYDHAPEIRNLYEFSGFNARVIDSTYSAHPIGGASFVGRELFYTNMSRLPAYEKGVVEHTGLTVRKYLPSMFETPGPTRIPCTSSAFGLMAA